MRALSIVVVAIRHQRPLIAERTDVITRVRITDARHPVRPDARIAIAEMIVIVGTMISADPGIGLVTDLGIDRVTSQGTDLGPGTETISTSEGIPIF